MKLDIPNYKQLDIQNIVFDYNGTLASGGTVSVETKSWLDKVSLEYRVYVITADTFGTVKSELEDHDAEVIVLSSQDHTAEKAAFVASLGVEHTIALGNGNNDSMMLKDTIVSIAIIGDEGCAAETMMAADIICKDIKDAMALLIHTDRLKATLRK